MATSRDAKILRGGCAALTSGHRVVLPPFGSGNLGEVDRPEPTEMIKDV